MSVVSLGHLVYLIDDTYLFTDDTIWLGVDGGYSFINVLAEDNMIAKNSLAVLEKKPRTRKRNPLIITGHTEWTDSLDFAFAHKDKVCNAWGKQKPHDPDDAYDETDDIEEKAKSVKLPKQNR